MNKNDAMVILKYVIALVILAYSSYCLVLNAIDYIDFRAISDLVQAILYGLIAIMSIVTLVMLIRKSLYRRKFRE